MSNLSSITGLKRIPEFKNAVDALFMEEALEPIQEEMLLGVSILLVKDYEANPTNTQSLEFAYWIILSHALQTGKYDALYDFSVAFGLYPICDAIYSVSDESRGFFADCSLFEIRRSFSVEGRIETVEQVNRAKAIKSRRGKDVAYIAPTSFGKSDLILDLALGPESADRICIVVPTKSLLNQMASSVKKRCPKRKILTHDEMYNGESRFIAVMTQERALRLLESNGALAFDDVFIDEAHHLYGSSGRSLLLSRLIKLVRRRNGNTRLCFTSPVISDVSHIASVSGEIPWEARIQFNMKEPRYLLYRRSGSVDIFNRFFGEYLHSHCYANMWKCIKAEAGEKNLIYVSSPRKIQQVARELASRLPVLPMDSMLFELIAMLRDHVHAEYDEIECVRHGVIYLHGQMPESIKDYLEQKYNSMDSIKFAVANTVILEGVNLPIDSIFVMSSAHLGEQSLVNLIGRASRLNRVFASPPVLTKLRPKVVFIDNDEYDRSGGNMENRLKLLRSSAFSDEITNPLIKREQGFALSAEDRDALEIEDYLDEKHDEVLKGFKAELYRLGFNDVYRINDDLARLLYERIQIRYSASQDLFDLIFEVFVRGVEDEIVSPELLRLRHVEARRYYSVFLRQRSEYPLHYRVRSTVSYFSDKASSNNPMMYVGTSFGERAQKGSPNFVAYVDLSEKTDSELVGLAVSKLQSEENLFRYCFARFVELLRNHDAIDESIFNYFTYGTSDKEKISLCQAGLPLPLINRLSEDNQLRNVETDKYGNLTANSSLDRYSETVDDFVRFEVNKYLL